MWLNFRRSSHPFFRQGLQYLVDFFGQPRGSLSNRTGAQRRSHHPLDGGGLEVLRGFFSRKDKSLTKINLLKCDFGI